MNINRRIDELLSKGYTLGEAIAIAVTEKHGKGQA